MTNLESVPEPRSRAAANRFRAKEAREAREDGTFWRRWGLRLVLMPSGLLALVLVAVNSRFNEPLRGPEITLDATVVESQLGHSYPFHSRVRLRYDGGDVSALGAWLGSDDGPPPGTRMRLKCFRWNTRWRKLTGDDVGTLVVKTAVAIDGEGSLDCENP